MPTPWPDQMMLRNLAAFIPKSSHAGAHREEGTLASSLCVGSWEQASMADMVLSYSRLPVRCGMAAIPLVLKV